MSPKDKAKELLARYEILDIENNNSGMGGFYTQMSREDAKECSLICVYEILNAVGQMPASVSTNFSRMFYKEVKQEIEKL